MDLTPLIFVAVFAGWAFYLIPRFMRDHEDLAFTRSVQEFSARLKVFAATRALPADRYQNYGPTAEIPKGEVREAGQVNIKRPLAASRTVAKQAAERRTRVLVALMTVMATVSGLGAFRVLSPWVTLIPALAVVIFLVSSRNAVRRQSSVRRRPGRPTRVTTPRRYPPRQPIGGPVINEADIEMALIAKVEAENETATRAAEHDGADDRLWDPVPVGLPVYIDKPIAQRTVMGIELNRELVPTSHDSASELPTRETDPDDTPVDLEAPRRVAGA